ncbi:MAG: erythronate-4-phosphate dehydrogenase [Gammaproteobacteria bacterium]|jgi:erythronate-4-phosphate dehydrogenase|tara:strand:- start:4826 stop:5875 length:1050 start_codon:yes stop_codon:yes gene_type:complete
MKIVVDQDIKYFKDIVELIDEIKSIDFLYAQSSDINNKLIRDAEVLFVRSTVKVNQDLLNNSDIKLIGSATAGFDHIDKDYLDKKNISWFHAPGCNASSVTHYVLSCIAFLIKNELLDIDSTIGIIGCGSVGNKLRKALNSLSIKNKAYDPFLDMEFLTNLDEVKECKLISLHTPLTLNSEYPTKNMLNSGFIETLKNKILINTSRGGIVDEDAILKNKDLIYLSDVWDNEPLPNKILINKSLIATPHIAGHSFNGKINGTIRLITKLLKYINQEDELENTLKKIDKHFLLNNESQKLLDINKYLNHYDVQNESKKFKKLYGECSEDELERTFKNLRSNHPMRRDIISY